MNVYITIEINEFDIVFDSLANTEKLSIDIAFNKYKFDILKDKQEKRLEYIATEISMQKRDVLVGNTCYNLDEIMYLINELKKYNLRLDSVFIPSPSRINHRIAKAKEDARLHGRWIGSSEDEVERNYSVLKATLQDIETGLSKTSIKLIEC